MRHRLEPGDDRNALGVDGLLQRVHLLILGDHPVAQVLVPRRKCPCGHVEILFRERGHAQEAGAEIIERLVEARQDMAGFR